MIDILGQLRRMMNKDATETFDPVTDSLEALSEALVAITGLVGMLSVASNYSHPNSVAEETILTLDWATLGTCKLKTFYLDLVNLTQNATIRVRYQIDTVNYRTIETFNWTVGMDDGVYIRELAMAADLRFTIQSAVLEGGIRVIPYTYIVEG